MCENSCECDVACDSTGSCGLLGGYRESGECAKDWDICDGMCEQKIVKDAHGCDALRYTPCAMNRPEPVKIDAGTK